MATSASYYGCTGNHAEFTCLSAYYHNKRFRKRDAWCDNCKSKYKYPEE